MAQPKWLSPQQRRQKGKIIGILIICAVFAVIFGAGFAYWNLIKSHVEIDKETLCPIAGAKSTTVVLIDRTDSLNPIQQDALLQKLDDIKTETPKYGAIEIYSVGEVSDVLLRPEVKLCNPGRGEDVDPT